VDKAAQRARVGLGALALALLSACAAPTAPREAATLSYPPAARERMLRLATAEWRDWGAITVDPARRPQTAEAESNPANFPRVLAYWRAVPEGPPIIAENRPLYVAALAGEAEGRELWRETPWSAAFISWVMAGAGVDAREFPPSASHSTYVDALIRDAQRYPSAAPFIPYLPAEVAAERGDLLCADRTRNPIRDWRDRAADQGRFRPMHCDIVVEAGPGHVEVIGGNVLDAVTRTRYPADASGYLLPQAPGTPTWFALFRNRLGKLPPWSPTQ